VAHKRARCQEMAAERLIDFEELRAQLAVLEDTRKTAERELHALQHRTKRLSQLKRYRDSLLESYAGVLPEVIDALKPEERRQVYRMFGTEAHLAPYGSLELSGGVVLSFSTVGISLA
jgi:hypothetical protein